MSRQSIKAAVPWLVHGVRWARWTRHQVQFPVAASAVEWRAAGRIIGGPFKGLRASGSGFGGGFHSMLLGTYESSLVPVLQSVIERAPATIVDAGAGWGYYALGLAFKCPRSRVIAYEMERTRADLLRKYAKLNGVAERVDVRGACTMDELEADLAGASEAFLLMDVEGAEDSLLRPDEAPALMGTEILVEVHDEYVPGVTGRVRERFAGTHEQTLFRSEPAPVSRELLGWMANYPILDRMVERMVDEGRETATDWLHLVPRGAIGAQA